MKVSATIRNVIVASLLAAGGFLMAAVTAVLLAGGRFGRCRCARPDQGLAFSKQESSRNFERRHKKRRASFRVASGSDVRENRGRIIWACRSMLADMPSSIRDPGIKRFQSCSDLVAGRGLPAMRALHARCFA